ncbi:MAG: S41 family peptidase [Lachnospiraceae bacterium]|nr:S41 family peptidase [Candidatus Colinaster scatohippi]
MEEFSQDVMEKEPDKKNTAKQYYVWGLLSGMLLNLIFFGLGMIGYEIYHNGKTAKIVSQTGSTAVGSEAKNEELINEEMIAKMATIEAIINKYYLDECDNKMLEDGIFDGMMGALGDKYARYYSVDEVKKLNEETGGYFCGIGATVSIDKETDICVIVEPLPDSPALNAGLIPGDLIYMVDGIETVGMDLDDVVKLTRGEEGTTVHITIIRQGESDMLEFDIVRGRVDSVSVGYEMLEGNIGHIAISTFDDNTADQFVDALATLKGQDAKGIIIDVRSNLGGNVTAVVDICRNIIPEGNIVYTLDKNGEKKEFKSDGTHQIGLPLVVLVNQHSASASEILTGAVKDYGIGTIVGITTYGKGVVQKVISLTDGSAVKLTASKYYTPNGICINGTGIEPDIRVELDYENYKNNGIDNQLEAAVDEINRLIK